MALNHKRTATAGDNETAQTSQVECADRMPLSINFRSSKMTVKTGCSSGAAHERSGFVIFQHSKTADFVRGSPVLFPLLFAKANVGTQFADSEGQGMGD